MKGAEPRICVVGSLVMDLVFRVQRRPGPGETAIGDGFGMYPGGKGFNQAVACRRLGAAVTFVGRCGADDFGHRFLAAFEQEGIAAAVTLDEQEGTAVACPTVDSSGENSIVVVPRANQRLTPQEVERQRSAIESADVLMLQLEVNAAASRRAAEIARAAGTLVILDPAPAPHTHGREAVAGAAGIVADLLVPNEHEATMLAHSDRPEDWAARLLRPGMRALVVTRGERGAVVFDGQGQREFPAFSVAAVDTVGAGDAFRAGLAVRLAEGATIDDAVRFANAGGALACLVEGSGPAMPRRAAVEAMLARNQKAG